MLAWKPRAVQSQETATSTNGGDCSLALLNDATIKPAVDSWILFGSSRDQAEATYGGPISQWNVSCVTDMKSLFKFASDFSEDLSGWDTRRLQHLDLAFEASTNFRANMSTWDVSRVVSMNRIFHRSSLFDADATGVSNWKTNNLQDLRSGFLASFGFRGDLSGWNTSSVNSMERTFAESFAFEGDVTGWDLQKVTSMDSLFQMASQFQGKISDWKTGPRLQTMRSVFSDTTEFQPTDREGNPVILDWNTENVTDLSFVLQATNGFNSDMVASWVTPSLTTMDLAFSKAKNFHGTQPSLWNTSRVSNFASLFVSTENFTSPLVSTFDTSNATSMSALFKFSKSFAADVSGWDTSKVRIMEEFAYESSDWMGVGLDGFNLASTTSLQTAFQGVINFPASQLSNWNTSKLRSARDVFLNADFKVEDDEPNPYPLCWDLDGVALNQLAGITCTSPEIGFDCACIDPELLGEINWDCADPNHPPCIGEVPDVTADFEDTTDAPTPPNLQSAASSIRYGMHLLLPLLTIAHFWVP